jgi:hypothetical protein
MANVRENQSVIEVMLTSSPPLFVDQSVIEVMLLAAPIPPPNTGAVIITLRGVKRRRKCAPGEQAELPTVPSVERAF